MACRWFVELKLTEDEAGDLAGILQDLRTREVCIRTGLRGVECQSCGACNRVRDVAKKLYAARKTPTPV